MCARVTVPAPRVGQAGKTLVELLRPYWVPVTPREGLDYLREQVAGVRMAALYRHYFPEEFARSTARARRQPEDVYTPLEIEFLHLVHERLFKLNEAILDWMAFERDEWDDEEIDGGPPSEIPVMSTGLGGWGEAALEDYRVGWRVLMIATGAYAPWGGPPTADDMELPADVFDKAIRLQCFRWVGTICWRLDIDMLDELAKGEEGPLVELPSAMRMLALSTGCALLDTDEEMPIEAYWRRPDVDWLIEERRVADEWWERVTPLLTWLEASPANMMQALELLEACCLSEQEVAAAAEGGRGRVAQ